MSNFDYQLGKLQGQFDALMYVNAKPNHSYSFEIYPITQEKNLLQSAENHLKQYYPDGVVSSEKLDDWQKTLSQSLEYWFFEFVYRGEEMFKHDKLHEFGEYGGFNCFNKVSRQIFALEFCQAIDDLLNVEEGFEIFLETNEWYEADWNDFALKGKNGSIFIHLGVSD